MTQTAPCNWPLNTDCCPEWDTIDPAIQANATAWATEILWALSGRQFGTCEVTYRPCGGGCTDGGYIAFPVQFSANSEAAGGMPFPFVDAGGVWRNCACPGACKCGADCEVWLPYPVASVTEVIVDGVIIPPTAYRQDNNNILVRQDGECWPKCQNFNLSGTAPDDENTFFVTYERGTAVPLAGQIAAGLMACEFARACVAGCVLPPNLSSLSRQGIEVQFPDLTDIQDQALTGIAYVDLWLRSVNPYKRKSRARVYSTDLQFPRLVS